MNESSTAIVDAATSLALSLADGIKSAGKGTMNGRPTWHFKAEDVQRVSADLGLLQSVLTAPKAEGQTIAVDRKVAQKLIDLWEVRECRCDPDLRATACARCFSIHTLKELLKS